MFGKPPSETIGPVVTRVNVARAVAARAGRSVAAVSRRMESSRQSGDVGVGAELGVRGHECQLLEPGRRDQDAVRRVTVNG